MLIKVDDAIAIGYCLNGGVRPFCKRHGIDFREFVKNGIDSDILIATGDVLAIKLVESVIGK